MIKTVKQDIRDTLRSIAKTCVWDMTNQNPATQQPYRQRKMDVFESLGAINRALSFSETSDDERHEIMFIKLWPDIQKVMPTENSRKWRLRKKALELYEEIVGEKAPAHV